MKKLAILITLMGGPAWAQSMTGNTLLDYCKSADEIEKSACLGYIAGAVDGAYIQRKVYRDLDVFDDWPHFAGMCFPSDVTREQIVDIVVGYLESNPAERHNPAYEILWYRLSATFPCQ